MSQPLLGRCKECDFTLFSGEEEFPEITNFAEIKQSGVVYVKDDNHFARCNQRHRVFILRRIKGTYSKDHKCDSRCLNAKGHECTCSCGGANHGRGHAVAVHEAIEETPEPDRFIGEPTKHVVGEVRVDRKGGYSGTVIYTFLTLDGTARLKWFAPEHADPDFEVGEVMRLRAKVKRHEDDPRWGKSTIITYAERQDV